MKHQLIFTPEQAKQWRLFSCDFTKEELDKASAELASVPDELCVPMTEIEIEQHVRLAMSASSPTFTITTPVDPQPRYVHGTGSWLWRDQHRYAIKGGQLHAAILAHWWTETHGNEGDVPDFPCEVELLYPSGDIDNDECAEWIRSPATLLSAEVVQEVNTDPSEVCPFIVDAGHEQPSRWAVRAEVGR